MKQSSRLVLGFLIFVALGVVLGVLVAPYVSPVFRQLQQLVGVPAIAQTGQVREYYIEIKGANIEISPGVTWKAWTYNGTVPGPTLMARVGDLIRVKAVNRLDLTHSLHPHMPYYELQHDGSQINIVTGVGKGSMIPPGGEWTYEWPATKPGIWYYHCHSGGPLLGGGHRIVDHMLMGLYGAIIVYDFDEPPAREFVIFMSELPSVQGAIVGEGPRPFYIMNGMGLPGGEPELELVLVGQSKIFPQLKGLEGVVKLFNESFPVFRAKVGEKIRFHIINIGDIYHSFHLHVGDLKSKWVLGGRSWPGQVVPLVPGAADTIEVTYTKPGVFLFHCHVVSHADAGMIGILIIEE